MDINIDEMMYEDRIAAIRTLAKDIITLVAHTDPYTVTAVMLELQGLQEYVEGNLCFDDYECLEEQEAA